MYALLLWNGVALSVIVIKVWNVGLLVVKASEKHKHPLFTRGLSSERLYRRQTVKTSQINVICLVLTGVV